MMTLNLTTGRISYLDPHIRLVEKESSKLAEEIDQLHPLIEQLQGITEDLDELHEITNLYIKTDKSRLGEATKQLMAGITHIEEALHKLKYGPEWDRTGRTCIESAYLENL